MTNVDALMREYDGAVPGASLLVIRDGQPIVRRAYGLADVADGVKATPATNYRLASVTKQFTATAIRRLAEEGKLTLDDRVRQWLPTLPASADTITIRHLLTHTSGLIDYEDVMAADTKEQTPRRGRAPSARIRGPYVLRARHELSVQQQRLRAAGADRRACLGCYLRDVSAGSASSSRSGCTTRLRTRRTSPRSPIARTVTRSRTAHGRARIRARPARCSATAGSIHRSTISRNGTRRCTTRSTRRRSFRPRRRTIRRSSTDSAGASANIAASGCCGIPARRAASAMC